MKPDIASKADIAKLMDLFYEKVRADELIGFFFTEVIAVNWQKHLPLMCGFWENILFHTGDYEGNPLVTHTNIHNKHATETIHFLRWLQLFNETVDAFYMGPNVEKIKQHAASIAAVMMEKIKPR